MKTNQPNKPPSLRKRGSGTHTPKTTSSHRLPLRRLLVPLDFSKTSLRALTVAVPLARDYHAQLWLLAVIEPMTYVAGVEGTALAVQESALDQDTKTHLAKIAAQRIPPPIKVSTLIGRGRPFEVITEIARQKQIDLIVLTTHGRTGLDRFLMGSTAERVVRHAPCPVYVVREKAPSRSSRP